jgi:5'-nucleotidase (lipoprotein e(P4) family)
MTRMAAPALALLLLLSGCATVPAKAPVSAAADTSAQTVAWTFGTAESAMLSQQAFRGLLAHVEAQRPVAGSASAILQRLEDGRAVMLACTAETAARPAVIFDLDETLLWNVGHQQWQARHHQPFDPAIWAQWEQDGGPGLLAAPGAVDMVARLRALGITPVFNSNRAAAHAPQTMRDLARLGLGAAVHGENLFLEGDAPGGSRKDARRSLIAQRYCVLAQAGDQMGDFTDGIDFAADGKRRPPAARTEIAAGPLSALWGRAWFLLPNPMYGRWNTPPLSLDEALQPADRWTPKDLKDGSN